MSVEAVSSSNSVTNERSTANDSKTTSLDTNTFLKLLVAQLKYQDPLDPQDNTEFVTQMAQMTSLQQMQQMNATLKNSQAYDMVGKEIYAEVLDSTTGEVNEYAGTAESVVIKDGIPYIVLGSTAINVDDVKQVFTQAESATVSQGTTSADTADTGTVTL